MFCIIHGQVCKQRSVIVKQSSVCQCIEREVVYNWNELHEKQTPIYIREKNHVSR